MKRSALEQAPLQYYDTSVRQDEEEDADEDEGEVGLQANARDETLQDDPPAHAMLGKSISGGAVRLFKRLFFC